jgi:mRNA-degrading endonuclease toxin of MazEF toxin-antitoxin module
MNESSKVRRGQVWWYSLPQKLNGTNNSIIDKTRPILIVSNDTNNLQSPVINVCPISTSSDPDFIVHIPYTANGKLNVVLVEQIKTIPVNDLNAQGCRYMYSLSDEVMKKVDEAIIIQLGISTIVPNRVQFMETLDRFIRSKVRELLFANNGRMTPEDYAEIEDRMNKTIQAEMESVTQSNKIISDKSVKLVDPKKVETPVITPKVVEPSVPDTPVTSTDLVSTPDTTSSKKLTKVRRAKWSREDEEDFLEACDTMPLSDVAELYNMQKSQVYQKRYYLLQKLRNTNKV